MTEWDAFADWTEDNGKPEWAAMIRRERSVGVLLATPAHWSLDTTTEFRGGMRADRLAVEWPDGSRLESRFALHVEDKLVAEIGGVRVAFPVDAIDTPARLRRRAPKTSRVT